MPASHINDTAAVPPSVSAYSARRRGPHLPLSPSSDLDETRLDPPGATGSGPPSPIERPKGARSDSEIGAWCGGVEGAPEGSDPIAEAEAESGKVQDEERDWGKRRSETLTASITAEGRLSVSAALRRRWTPISALRRSVFAAGTDSSTRVPQTWPSPPISKPTSDVVPKARSAESGVLSTDIHEDSYDPAVLPILSYLSVTQQPALLLLAEPLRDAIVSRVAVVKTKSPEGEDDSESESGQRESNSHAHADSRYPSVTGEDADKGRGHRLADLLTPVWQNASYDRLLQEVELPPEPRPGGDPSFIGLVDPASAEKLVQYLRSVLTDKLRLSTSSSSHVSLHSGYALKAVRAIDVNATFIKHEDNLTSTRPYLILTCNLHHATIDPASNQILASSPQTPYGDVDRRTISYFRPHLRRAGTSSSATTSTAIGDELSAAVSRSVPTSRTANTQQGGRSSDETRPSPSILNEYEGGNFDTRVQEYEGGNLGTPRSHEIWGQNSALSSLGSNTFLSILRRSSMGRYTLDFPWHATPLGPLNTWSPVLRSYACHMLSSKFRTSLWWGPQCVLLYNDEYVKTAGAKHPWLFGKSGGEAWAEIWDSVGPLAQGVLTNAETVIYYDNMLMMTGRVDDPTGLRIEETYHTWTYIPCFEGGKAVGFMNFAIETTSRVIAERRLSTLRQLTQTTALAKTTQDYCDAVMAALSTNPYDITFGILYTAEDVAAKSLVNSTPLQTSTSASGLRIDLDLHGVIGVPPNHPSAKQHMQLRPSRDVQRSSSEDSAASSTGSNRTGSSKHDGDEDLAWPLHEACETRKPIFMADCGDRTESFEARGWGDPTRAAVVIPIANEDQAPSAVLVVGLNPRRPYNEQYGIFLQLLARQLATGFTTVRAYQDQVKKAEELANLDRAKSAFFSNVSHELRTPLTLILGPLRDVIALRDLPPGSKGQLKMVLRHGERLLKLVNSLLDFSRLEAGRLVARFRPVRLSTFTADLASLFRSAIERGSVSYEVDCGQEDTIVWVDPDLWEKIVFNLIGNSYKYTLTGQITVRVRYTASEALFSVSDTGCGIEPDQLDSIFDRFHRVESTARSHEGTGIGLALTLELIKILHGSVSVRSNVGVGSGSTFTVKIPLGCDHISAERLDTTASADDVHATPNYGLTVVKEAALWGLDRFEDSDVVSSAPSSGGSSGEVCQVDLSNLHADKTILIADDNVDMRRYCRSILAPLKAKIVEVGDGIAALQYIRANSPELVLSDVMMPKLDGINLLKTLRADPVTQLTSIILVSARAGAEARADGLMQGADDYLVKPFQAKELLARVHTQLQFSAYRRELELRVHERTRALVESESRYRSLADRYHVVTMLGPVGVFALDGEGKILFANPKWYEISGYTVEDPLDDWISATHEEDRAREIDAWMACLRQRQPWMAELRWKATGNWCQIDIRPYVDPESGQEGFVGSITDISARKRVEELHIHAVEQRAHDAETMRQQQEQFIDMTSHEMRNPLSGIWQNAEMIGSSLERIHTLVDSLRNGEMPPRNSIEDLTQELEQDTDSVDSILLCAAHQRRIADDILNASKLSMGMMSLSKSSFDICAKITSTLQMFRLEATQANVSLNLHVCDGINALGVMSIRADPNRIGQVVTNFVSNSLKFLSPEATEHTITVHVDAASHMPPPPPEAVRVLHPTEPSDGEHVWIIIAVEDSGRGLDKEQQAKLFERFSQAKPRSDGMIGSGLGLFVSKQLVELHKGFIEVQSEKGKGSTFCFGFPAEKTAAADVDHTFAARSARRLLTRAEPSADSAHTLAIAVATPRRNRHILVVEDNLINQKVLRKQLTQRSFEVTVANNGQEALDLLFDDENSFDLVLMDIEMPVKNGIVAVQELRTFEESHRRRQRLPCIAVTGNARAEQISTCMQAGFDDVVTKPYRLAGLLEKIDRLSLIESGVDVTK